MLVPHHKAGGRKSAVSDNAMRETIDAIFAFHTPIAAAIAQSKGIAAQKIAEPKMTRKAEFRGSNERSTRQLLNDGRFQVGPDKAATRRSISAPWFA